MNGLTMQEPSVLDILASISDNASIVLLDTIATQPTNCEILRGISRLTRRQYYLRISRLVDSGIVTRRDGKYHITSLGKMVCEALKLVEKAIENYWRLEAIDSIQSLPTEERNRIIDALMRDNDGIKEILKSGGKGSRVTLAGSEKMLESLSHSSRSAISIV